MKQSEILNNVDKEKLRLWLSCVYLPLLVSLSTFVDIGFEEHFVRQFLRKHNAVLQLNGKVQQNVRGVSELDFLQGLAEALGVNISETNKRSPKSIWIRQTAEACLKFLDKTDNGSRE